MRENEKNLGKQLVWTKILQPELNRTLLFEVQHMKWALDYFVSYLTTIVK